VAVPGEDPAVPADTGLPATWTACAALLPHVQAVLGLTSGGLWRTASYLGYSTRPPWPPANLAYWSGQAERGPSRA
jgi:hypothetical protein